MDNKIKENIKTRRTFAIISHPDAGKTTITEKLLLFGGAIQTAGAIKAKKSSKHTTSDWMELEKQRGVSVSTSVMCFRYNDFTINLLDTPGHADFSEDTYRTLTAVDSVLMVIDSVKGVESRTKKLMDICQMRKIPVITFINKMDREGINPFDLLDNIEKKLKIHAIPLSWPISMGKTFKGIYDLKNKSILQFAAGTKKYNTIPLKDLNSDKAVDLLDQEDITRLNESLELIDGAIDPFDQDLYLAGKQTPVFFGSAINNFGIIELLNKIIDLAPSPKSREALERNIEPLEKKLTSIVFKIHANMDPKHRDRIAFMRICSGIFSRGMKLKHTRMNREIKISNPITFMAQTRSIVEKAYPGDIIGIHDTGKIRIGDTFTEGEKLTFTGIPNFSPEIFKKVINQDPMRSKQLNKGLIQLLEEGVIQLFKLSLDNQIVLGAVGALQFEVVKFRLENEYGAKCNYSPLSTSFAYWLKSDNIQELYKIKSERKANVAVDNQNNLIFLFNGIWELEHMQELYPKIKFYKTSDCNERDSV